MKKVCALLCSVILSLSLFVPTSAYALDTETYTFHGVEYTDVDLFIDAVIDYYGSLENLPVELLAYLGSMPVATAYLNNVGWNSDFNNEIERYQSLQYIGGRVISRFDEYSPENKRTFGQVISNWFSDTAYYTQHNMPLTESLAKAFLSNVILGGLGAYVDSVPLDSSKVTQSSVIPYSYYSLLTDAQLKDINEWAYTICYNSATFAYYILPKDNFIGILINPNTGLITPVKNDFSLQTSSYSTNSGYGIRNDGVAWVYAAGATFGLATIPNASSKSYSELVRQCIEWGYIAPIRVGTSWANSQSVEYDIYSPISWETPSLLTVPSDTNSYDFLDLLLADDNFQSVVQGQRQEWQDAYENDFGERPINEFLSELGGPISALASLVENIPNELKFMWGGVILLLILAFISRIMG